MRQARGCNQVVDLTSELFLHINVASFTQWFCWCWNDYLHYLWLYLFINRQSMPRKIDFCYTKTRACWKSWHMRPFYWRFQCVKSQTGSFLQNSWRLLTVNYFRKKLQSYNFNEMNCFTYMFHQYIYITLKKPSR